ncbi:hypothetical protein KGV31_002154 [Vibrio parahaemolyticus]|nr:hypothetical protein [Vibrio parahaemolyticus]EHU0344297.1 hypothetical protein [Vibrio parahaemolyticus]EHU0354331.1 hypothetical protein [Vibrio parahaemolyticus]
MTKQKFINLIKRMLVEQELTQDQRALIAEQVRLCLHLYDAPDSFYKNQFIIRTIKDIQQSFTHAFYEQAMEEMFTTKTFD